MNFLNFLSLILTIKLGFIFCQENEEITYRVFRNKDLDDDFKEGYLLLSSSSGKGEYTETRRNCKMNCDEIDACAAYTFSQATCSLFKKVPNKRDMHYSEKTNLYVKYPRSCKDIKAYNSSARCGEYTIYTTLGPLKVYCDMYLDGGGYTFLPTTILTKNLKPDFFEDIFTNKKKVLLRLLTKTKPYDQKYTLIEPLEKFKLEGVSLYIETKPQISIRIQLVPKDVDEEMVTKEERTHGFVTNGMNITYYNCANQSTVSSKWRSANHFLFYKNQLGFDEILEKPDLVKKWFVYSSRSHPLWSYMPLNASYFFYTGIYFGSEPRCGTIITSEQLADFKGVAFGFM